MHPPLVQLADYVGPTVAAVIFVLLMSLIKEPTRQKFNAILVAGASGVYMSGGFGLWELLFAAVAGSMGFFGLRSYRFIGLGWLLHAAWDLAHHFHGNAIWPFMPTSSFGCMIFDALIAIWFFTGAKAVPALRMAQRSVGS